MDDDIDFKKIIGWSVLVLGVVFLAWGLWVLLSPAKGAGDAYVQKNSANNWVAAQAGFHRDYETIKAFGQQISDAQQQLTSYEAAHPSLGNGTPYDPVAQQDTNLRTTLTGLQQQCQNTVSDYNTRAQSYLTRDFRDAGLPDRIDVTTECRTPAVPTTTPTTPSR